MKPALFAIFVGTAVTLSSHGASGDILSLDDALRATYVACVDIDDELSELKKMAGINTAVTSVGTAAGVGATVTGFVKQSKDKQIADLEKQIAKLTELEQRGDIIPITDEQELKSFSTEIDSAYAAAVSILDRQQAAQAAVDKLTTQSKKLGNWRTGLLGAGTATNVAGAVIAGTNKADADLQTQIKNCRAAVANLRNSMMQARISGTDVAEAQDIISACGEYDYVDVSKINTRGRGAMISSTIGAATGLAGTVTSAVANTDKTRRGDERREQNLNTAANVLSIGTTAASAAATVLNATQISAVKKVAAVAEKCTGVLK